jgi:hypothetical protein
MLRIPQLPMSTHVRAPALLFLLALVSLFAAAPADAGPLDRFNPFASFESRCDALPPARFEVVAAPVTFTEDYSQSLRTLSSRHDGAQINHRTVGLTEAHLAFESTLESRGVEDRLGGRACARPSIRVVFSATPMVVFIAREFSEDGCRRNMIREHEMKHVAVYRQYLSELVERAERELPAIYGEHVVYARDAHDSRESMRGRLQRVMHGFMQAHYVEVKRRQAEIDSPEEYARLALACVVTSPA